MTQTALTPAAVTGTPGPAVVAADRSEVAVDALVVAFAADPVIRWLLPRGDRYLSGFADMARVVASTARTGGAVDTAADGAGAALWLAPGTELPEEEVAGVLTRAMDEWRLPEAGELLQRMDEHHPTEPLWYLPFIGVDPCHQGRGIGSDLLRQGLARCDTDGLPAYLEASSPRNRVLYERHGFEVVAEVRVGDSPPLWPMRRPAR